MPLPTLKSPIKTGECASGQLLLGLVIVVGFFFTLYEMLNHPIPEENHDIVITMLSVLGAGLMAVLGFYFATSFGAQKKDEALTDTIKNPPVQPVAPPVVPVVNMTQTQSQPPQNQETTT